MKGKLNALAAATLTVLTLLCTSNCKKEESFEPAASVDNQLAPTMSMKNHSGHHFLVNTLAIVETDPVTAGVTRVCSAKDGTLYATSANTGKVYKISSSGTVSLIAEGLNTPIGIKVGPKGEVYVANFNKGVIKITPDGTVSTVPISLALSWPEDIAVADDGTLYIADTFNHRIIKVTPGGIATVFAGNASVQGTKDGMGSKASFSLPTSIKLAKDGYLWVLDGGSIGTAGYIEGRNVRKISLQGKVSTVFKVCSITSITDLAVAKRDRYFNPSPDENLFVTFDDNSISHLTGTGKLTPFAINTTIGNVDGPLKDALFFHPQGISIREDAIYIADHGNASIRKIVKK
ncbi:hypothetical protein GS399_04120 [Pedobacter sp. HMF7647]|uniref:SMP-30/Gluconolactonase/LRE-like region domain-containing protein n=1 Tax=Hufsiella arboris TaxID=2695275 RepID=A0A7K1Y6E8_9SPHI|nr:hypothetical protein [Hufsiella arboris]MXV50145.1 hypothetical protein [Hufsiella arboris]